MNFTLRQLEYVAAVERTRSFGRAAQECHVSQPGLSQQMQQIERALGVRLFERDRRQVLPTPAGLEVARRADDILRLAQELGEIGRSFGEPLTGELRMGVIPTVAPYLIPQASAHLREAFPELRLLLYEDRTADLVARLERGELDVLLIALESELGSAVRGPLLDDPFVLAVPANDPVAEKSTVDESDLSGRPLMLLDDGHCLRDQALTICQRAGADERGDFRASSLGTLLQMVASGVTSTLIPSIAVDTEVRADGPVRAVPFRWPGPSRTIGLAWRQTTTRVEEFVLLGNALKAAWQGD